MRYLITVVYVMLFGIALVAQAEEAQPAGFSVLTVDVKPGSQQQFEAFIAKYKEAVDKVGGPVWFAESPGIGSQTTYSFARPFNSFTELNDQSNPVIDAFGADVAQETFALFSNSVVSSQTATYHGRPDLSSGNDGEGAEIVLSFGVSVNPGKNEMFESWVKKLIAADENRRFNMYQLGFGEGPDYAVRVPTTWAALDTPATPIPAALEKKYGKKEAKRLMADNAEAVASIQQSVSRIRNDMSNLPSE